MKTHTSSFKEQIKLIGKEIDSRITFGDTVLGKDDLNAVTPSYQGAILKSVMKQLDIDSNVAIPIGTILKYEFGLKVNGEYEYINYGNYVVYSIEKQEDTNSYKIVCYDKLLYSMLDYVKLPITYPISVRDYINAISTALGLTFANNSGTFANYDKQIQADLYDGLGYTFRDVLDELAQVTASTICLNNNDELEIRYITETGDTIDEEFLKDVNVNFGEKFGAVNTIVLSRSGDSDSVYYPEVLPTNPYEIKISDNQIMNGNDRADFLPDIYGKLNGLEFYTNDFASTGIIYYDLCDRYSVEVGDNTYSCVIFNDEVLVTQGLEENVYTELPQQTETDYKHASKDDRMINQVYIIAKKNEAEILAVVNTTEQLQKEINPTKNESGSEITIEDASDNPLTYLEIEGKSTQKTRSGDNLYNFNDRLSATLPAGVSVTDDGWITITYDNTSGSEVKYLNYWTNNLELETSTNYNVITEIKNVSGSGWFYPASDSGNQGQFATKGFYYDFVNLSNGSVNKKIFSTVSSFENVLYGIRTFVRFNIGQSGSITFRISVLEDTTITADNFEYEAYGASPSPDYPSEIESVGYENLFDINSITENYLYEDGGIFTPATTYNTSDYISCKSNEFIVSAKFTAYNPYIRYIIAEFDENKTYIQRQLNIDSSSPKYTFTLNDNTKYIRLCYRNDATLYDIQLGKGSIAHPYIPYGKYGIEVKTTGKNLFNKENIIDGWIRASDNKYWNETGTFSCTDYIKVKPNTTYTLNLHNATSLGSGGIMEYDNKKAWLNIGLPETNKLMTFTTSENTYYIRFTVRNESVDYIQLEESSVETEYQPYQERITVMQLNAPLRSLPNGVEDIAYIRNNKLYVDRYAGSVVLDGSENWLKSTGYSDNIYFCGYLQNSFTSNIISDASGYNNRFKIGVYDSVLTEECMAIRPQLNVRILANRLTENSVNGLKTWLSTNNTQIDYELATPVTEEIGEIEMLKTLKGYNNISTTDKLLPIINLTYVRDTVIADYVENHVTELKLTENEIKASVESVSSSVDGLNTTINRVEEITNDNSQVINVISTNIDKTSGEVREVTTTTGFTFNADGMTIDDGSGFKAEHTANGTYYKDGNSIVGQYTKDGSKQKDLELFGTYSYGKESIEDTPMFVGQLYTDANGERGFGHFYNGEG